MIGLLDHDEGETRAQAIQSLSRRRTESARQALQQHLTHESDETLRNKINEAFGITGNE
jgi:HEAT repeat protein